MTVAPKLYLTGTFCTSILVLRGKIGKTNIWALAKEVYSGNEGQSLLRKGHLVDRQVVTTFGHSCVCVYVRTLASGLRLQERDIRTPWKSCHFTGIDSFCSSKVKKRPKFSQTSILHISLFPSAGKNRLTLGKIESGKKPQILVNHDMMLRVGKSMMWMKLAMKKRRKMRLIRWDHRARECLAAVTKVFLCSKNWSAGKKYVKLRFYFNRDP